MPTISLTLNTDLYFEAERLFRLNLLCLGAKSACIARENVVICVQ